MKTMKQGLAMILAAALVHPLAGADEGNGQSWKRLEGVWLVRLAPKVCGGGPLPAPPLLTLFTFHEGGTLSGSLQNYAITATNRTLSHGLWERAGVDGEYSLKFVHLRYDFATGVFLGTQQAVSRLVMHEGSDGFTADSAATGFDANGNQAYTSCSTLTGERIQLP